MRPYLLPLAHVWIDLDSVQSISEPRAVYHAGVIVAEFEWQRAFADKPNVYGVHQPRIERDKPELDAHGVPTEVARLRREVFLPFLCAWTGRADPKEPTS